MEDRYRATVDEASPSSRNLRRNDLISRVVTVSSLSFEKYEAKHTISRLYATTVFGDWRFSIFK